MFPLTGVTGRVTLCIKDKILFIEFFCICAGKRLRPVGGARPIKRATLGLMRELDVGGGESNIAGLFGVDET